MNYNLSKNVKDLRDEVLTKMQGIKNTCQKSNKIIYIPNNRYIVFKYIIQFNQMLIMIVKPLIYILLLNTLLKCVIFK